MYECAHSFITYNNLNLPSYDVNSVEARDQMLVNLYKLQESFVKINNIITEKNKQQNQRIQAIRQRINKCLQKIGDVQEVKKAICFVSPGEYPIKYKFDPEKNVSIFKQLIERTKVNKLDLDAHYQMKHQIQKVGEVSKLQLQNLYKFVTYIYGKLKCKKMSVLESGVAQKKVKTNNLGRIPNTIRYVDSLTVFDTYINPYKNYQLNTKKVVSNKKPKQPEQQIQQQIISITNYTKPSFSLQNPNYRPIAQQVTQIAADDNIGLDGVVDIDIDDFLTGMNTTANVVQKKVLNQKPAMSKQSSQVSNNNNNVGQSSIKSAASTTNSSILPPPPSMISNSSSSILPPPPPLNFTAPQLSGSLPPPPPPPSLSTLPPPPSLSSLPPPPPLSSMSLPPPPTLSMPMPTSSSSGAEPSRADLLKQLNDPNPMARLKKTVTKQTPNLIPAGGLKPSPAEPSAQGGAPAQSGRPVSLMQALQLKIRTRFKLLHPEKEQQNQN